MHTFIRFTSMHRTDIRRACGFTLVEVLMAVFVLAVALAGTMHLHLSALRAQRQSSYHGIALQLAGDMAEMIRAWSAPGTDAPFLFDYHAGDALPAGADCLNGAICDPDALRRFGVAQWLGLVNASLPAARVSICRDAAPWDGNGFRWACSGGNAGIVVKLGWRAGHDSAPQLVLNIGEPS